MPFNSTTVVFMYGIHPSYYDRNIYCVNDIAASDYGTCYNVYYKAIFIQADTTTYPVGSLPCESNNTCIRYTTTAGFRTNGTIFSYPGKQGILQYFWSRVHSVYGIRLPYLTMISVPTPSRPDYLWFFPATIYESLSWPIYDPVSNFKAYLNPYTIPGGNVSIIRWSGNVFTSSLYIMTSEEGKNNMWYAFDMSVSWAYESSPLAVIPLDYEHDYAPYVELRSVFGYAATGVDQPGWNADDIIRVLRELFPNRAWAVFDDRQYVLYLYNLTPDYVPDWLIEKLSPTAMKVLQSPADAAVAKAWLDLLNERNAQIPPQAELP